MTLRRRKNLFLLAALCLTLAVACTLSAAIAPTLWLSIQNTPIKSNVEVVTETAPSATVHVPTAIPSSTSSPTLTISSTSAATSDPASFSPTAATVTPVPAIPVVEPTFLSSAPFQNKIWTPGIPSTCEKSIKVVISQQRLYAYDCGQIALEAAISSGAYGSTPLGSFSILDKEPNAWSDLWGFWMPDWMGFVSDGYVEDGFHSLPVQMDGSQIWGDKIGTPVSGGCIVLEPEDALSLYNWAEVGTKVEIQP